ncbi:MAG: TonB-dependent receptor, partial [Verrucomicrobia bacterium]|nr:TonB-dependent receptor [Verrucomicrobiota bacterium]
PTYTNGLFADNSGNLYLVNPGTKGPSISQNDFTLGTTGVNSNNVVWNYQLEPREQRFGTYLKAKYQPTDWLQFYQQFSYQRNKDQGQIGTISPSGSDNITIPANNPYNPFGVPLSPQNTWFTEFGPAKTYTTVDTLRTVTGATLFLPNNWTVDASFLYAESDGDMHSINAIQKDKLQEALNGTLPGYQGQFYNPFVDFAVVNSPNGNLVNAIRTTTDTYSRTSLAIWSLKAGGDVIELPNGTVKAGFGLEYRSDKFNNYFDTNSKEGNIIGSGAQPSTTSASRYVRSAYFEFSFPILGNKWSFPGARSLEFDVQERFDDYSDFGEAAKPKFLVLYKPFDDLTLRATYSEGYRAPSLTELYSGTVYEQAGGLIDPQHPELGAQTYNIHVSGNPHLKAETAYSYYAGAVWSPGSVDPQHSWWGWANGFTAYVDWFQVVQRSQILQLTPSDALQNESQFPSAVVRFPSGFINYINSSYVNEGAVLVDGIDFGGSYNTKEFSWGKLELAADASYQYNHSVKDTNTSPVFLEDDSFHYPDFQLNASVFYSKTLFELDTLRTGFVINYTDSLHDTFDNFKGTNPSANVEPNGLVHRVGSYTTVNWQISYSVGPAPKVTAETPRVGYGADGKQLAGESGISPKAEVSRNPLRTWFGNTTLTFGINNVFDARPPFADELFAFDPYASESPIGRYFYVELRKKF